MQYWMRRLQRQTCLLLAALILISGSLGSLGQPVNAAAAEHVVISQVYGGGGNGTGASFKQDFIELYNPTDEEITLDGMKLIYASATGAWPTSGNNLMPLSGKIGPGKYYLTQQASGTDTTVPNLPSPDATGTLSMAGASGKVKLVDSDGAAIDLVGYGSANEFEGTGPTGTLLTNVTAAIRKPLNIAETSRDQDTDDNSVDFATGTPSPRNSAYGSVVENVQAQPGTGIVAKGDQVTLMSPTAGASIYYRVNAASPSDEYVLYSTPITINQAATIETYAAKEGMTNSSKVSYNYTISAVTTIAEARILADNTNSLIEGIVTYKEVTGGQVNLYVQDETAGIVVRGPGLTAETGDKIKASGTVKQYFGLAQLLVEASNVTITVEDAGVPVGQLIQSTGMGESVEAEFVSVENVTAGASNAYNEFTVTDDKGTFIIKSPFLESGEQYERINGVVTFAFNNYMLIPRSSSDVIKKVVSVIASPSPSGLVQAGTAVTLNTPADGGKIYYTTDGSEPTAVEANEYQTAITIATDTIIKAIVVAGDVTSEVFTFSYNLQKTYDNLKIHDIQAATHLSPYAGHMVTGLEGIITMKRSDGKWFLQGADVDSDEFDSTSEAILIQPNISVSANVGDKVTLAGTVHEVKEEGYADAKDLTTTQITASAISVLSNGNDLPLPVIIGTDRIQPTSIIDNDGMRKFDPEKDALDFYESLEGMRVQLNDARIVGPFNYETPVVLGEQPAATVMTPSGGIILTGKGLNPQRILIAKEPAQKVKTGDKFNDSIIGVMSYDFSNYKVIPESLPKITVSTISREVTSLEASDGKLTVASFNIENFWNNPSRAETTRKNNIAKSIVTNLKSPDIVALIEVQDNNGTKNDGTTDASASFEALIAAISANGGPAYSYTDIAPVNNEDGGALGGNIRVGYLYNHDRVTLVEKTLGKGDATTAVSYGAEGLSHNPGRIDPTNDAFEDSRKPLAAEFEFQSEKVVVIANHFNSKGGDEAPFGAVQPLPEILGSEVQRHKIAKVVNNFVQSIYEKNAKANVILLGDLNDFQFSKTLELTKGNRLTNLVDALPENERYSYVYQGNSQTLDHILVDKKLAKYSSLDIVHINADFDASQGRVSDHDPLLVQVDLAAKKKCLLQ
ncbi:MAG: chitobiase/beta-hexosaminidase C-terminal domain-containing protein [Bacillota bacterium]